MIPYLPHFNTLLLLLSLSLSLPASEPEYESRHITFGPHTIPSGSSWEDIWREAGEKARYIAIIDNNNNKYAIDVAPSIKTIKDLKLTLQELSRIPFADQHLFLAGREYSDHELAQTLLDESTRTDRAVNMARTAGTTQLLPLPPVNVPAFAPIATPLPAGKTSKIRHTTFGPHTHPGGTSMAHAFEEIVQRAEHLMVIDANGNEYSIDMVPSIRTIRDLKATLQEPSGIPITNQHLLLGTKEYFDDKPAQNLLAASRRTNIPATLTSTSGTVALPAPITDPILDAIRKGDVKKVAELIRETPSKARGYRNMAQAELTNATAQFEKNKKAYENIITLLQ
jgi:hypothetical protein